MATYESKKYDIPIQADTIANQSVSNAEFQTLDGISTGSTIAAQLNTKLDSAGAFVVQTGMIIPFSAVAGSVPTGYLLCNGAAVSRSTYSALFALISTTYGVGDGSSTFNVPNVQSRMIIGKSGSYALGSTGGATTDSFTPSGSVSVSVNNHTLTLAQIPSHSHGASTSVSGSVTLNKMRNQSTGNPFSGSINRVWGNNAGPTSDNQAGYANFSGSGSTSISNAGGGGSHNHGASGSFSGNAGTVDVLNPYISLNHIIKT